MFFELTSTQIKYAYEYQDKEEINENHLFGSLGRIRKSVWILLMYGRSLRNAETYTIRMVLKHYLAISIISFRTKLKNEKEH